MRLDRSHRVWLVGTVLATVLGGVAYFIQARMSPSGPRGNTVIGLTFGILASFFVLFAWLLAARKKVLLLRVGTLTWWMRGHLWLGFLSLPMALYHGAFEWGGPLTATLMVLLIAIVVSGVLGAALQHAMPGMMTARVTREHTFEQLEQMKWNLRREAYEMVIAACGPAEETAAERQALEQFMGHAPHEPKKIASVGGQKELKEFYVAAVLPCLTDSSNGQAGVRDATQAVMMFDDLRPRLDPSLHAVLDDLEDVCEESRQVGVQARLHRWLHGWLWVHVPLSMALVILMFAHAVMALYY
jgi:hypothetical protein